MADKMTERETAIREKIKDRQRIVVKIGSSSLHHMKTGELTFNESKLFPIISINYKNNLIGYEGKPDINF